MKRFFLFLLFPETGFRKEVQAKKIAYFLRKSATHQEFNEDVFWATQNPTFVYPTWQEAIFFALDTYPELGYQLMNNEHPFGCHGWHKLNYQYWRPVIERYGYQLPTLSEVEFNNTLAMDHRRRLDYLLQRELREGRISAFYKICLCYLCYERLHYLSEKVKERKNGFSQNY